MIASEPEIELEPTVSVSLRARFGNGVVWNLAASLLNQGSAFLISIVMARLLGRSTFGQYAMVQSTLLTLCLIAQLATGSTAVKYVAEFRLTNKEKTGRILGICSLTSLTMLSVVALSLLIGAPYLATFALKAPHLAPALRIGAGVLLFAGINGYQTGALAGLETYRSLAQAAVINACLSVILSCVGAWVMGLNGAICGLLFSNLLQWLILRYHLKRECSRNGITISYRGLTDEWPIITRFALPAALSGLISMPALWLANAYLARQPSGYSQMALYSAAMNLRVLVLFLPNIVNSVGISLLNNHMGTRDGDRYKKIFWGNMGLTVSAALVAATVVWLVGPTLLKMFGKSFVAGNQVVSVLVLAGIVEAAAISAYQVLQSQERIWLSLFAISIPRDSLILLLAYIMVPLYGAVGLACAYTIGWTLALIIICILSVRIGLTRAFATKQ